MARMVGLLLGMATLAAQASPLNPRALEFIEHDAAIKQWAEARFDRNHDGWLTLYEAQEAVDQFRQIADEDRDGRITTREYRAGVAFLKARY